MTVLFSGSGAKVGGVRVVSNSSDLVQADAGSLLVVDSGDTSIDLTIPLDSDAGWEDGVSISCYQASTAIPQFQAAVGVTLHNPFSVTSSQYSTMSVVKIAANEWAYVTGDIISSGTVTSITAGTGLTGGTITSTGTIAVNTSVVPLKSDNLSVFGATTSAQLAGIISNETGTGSLVFGTGPTLSAPVISSIVNVGTLTIPTSTDTLAGRATTDVFTNKTYDTAGTGNVFKINGTTLSDKTGTGKVVLDTSPTIASPTLTGTTTLDTASGLHFKGRSATPAILEGAGAGTSPTVSISGSDASGEITVTTGTFPTGTNATVATITFASAYGATPTVVFSPSNAVTAALSGVSMVFADAPDASTFTITSGTTALAGSTTYKWNYVVVQ